MSNATCLKDCIRTISDVYYVSNLSTNLLSVSAITKKGYTVEFNNKLCRVYDKHECLVTGTQTSGVYQLDTVSDNGCVVASAVMASAKIHTANAATMLSQEVWPRRLGHLNSRSMQLLQKGMSSGISYSLSDFKQCIPCIESKQSRLPFPKKSHTRAKEKLGLVHSE